MKKITLTMIAAASMLLAAPAMDTMPMQGKCMKKMKQGKMCCKKKRMKNRMDMKSKMGQKKMNSPFLIKHGLPHLSKMIMPYMDDPAFNVTEEQKKKLTEVRQSTMSAIMEVKPKVMALKKEIISASQAGVSLDILKGKVAKLALLESTATLTHLKCIEATKAILTKDQMYFLFTHKNKGMNHGKRSMIQKKCKKCVKK